MIEAGSFAQRADISQYNTAFDSQRFTTLMDQRGTEGFEERLSQEITYTRVQLRSDLGERLHVAKSEFVYEIRDGKLYDPIRKEPMEELIERGMGRNPVDKGRDKAEMASFRNVVQGFLAKDDTPDGTTILAVSPPGKVGSFERKNYFRIFVKEGNYVLGASYFADLSNEKYRNKILSLNPSYSSLIPESPTDVDLKSVPVVVPRHFDYSANPDKLAEFILDGKEVGISQEVLKEAWLAITPMVTSYTNTLVDNPKAIGKIEEGYIKVQVEGKKEVTKRGHAHVGNKDGVIVYIDGKKETIGGGACGSGGCFTGPDGRGPLEFTCPSCGGSNTRPMFGYVYNCDKCGSDKVLPRSVKNS